METRSMAMFRLPALLVVLLALLWGPATLPAQTGAGQVQGTVRDATGAVLPAAHVVIVHTTTGRAYRTDTNGAGLYVFPPVQAGEYRISVEFAGMEKWEGTLTLQVSQTAVVDPMLKIAGTATEVVVFDVTPLVNTETPTLSNVLERTRIEQLPLNGRLLQGLIGATTPGLENGSNPRVFGLSEGSTEFVQDGAVINSRDRGAIATRPPGIDTVQEFAVETSASSAKMNRPATAIISTRSGTNSVHGAVFETARNNSFGVARRRQDYYDKAPQLIRNEFGASLGGPVYLPKIYNGRNRTFFFAAWEQYELRQSNTASTRMVTGPMRGGDFTGLVDSIGRQITLYDPWTTANDWSRVPFAGNIIPLQRRSPVAKAYYDVTPLPNIAGANPMVKDNYSAPGIANRGDITLTFRFDHRLSDKDQLFVRYTHGSNWRKERRAASGNNGSPILLDGSGNVDPVDTRNESASLSWTHTFSPTFFSETIASGAAEDYWFQVGTNTVNFADQLGLPNPFKKGGRPDAENIGFSMIYIGSKPRDPTTRLFNIDQNFTKIVGRHQFEFGGRLHREILDVMPDQNWLAGRHRFSSLATALYDKSSGATSPKAVTRTGYDAANFYLGIAQEYMVQYARGWYYFRAKNYGGYWQDTYKATKNLTLTYGLRYEYNSPLTEKNNLLNGFDPKTLSIVNGRTLDEMYKMNVTTPAIVGSYTAVGVKFATPSEVGLPDNLIYSNYRNFGPRAGFAYRIGSGARQTVIRGGYGMYTFPMALRSFYTAIRNNPPTTASFSQSYVSAAQSPDGIANWSLRNAPTVVAGVNSADVLKADRPNNLTRGSFRTVFFDPHQPDAKAHQFNLTVEREILDNMLLRFGYRGTHGSDLEEQYALNSAPNEYVWYSNTGLSLPTGDYSGVARRYLDKLTYGDIFEYKKTGWSNYNGFQVEVQRRYTKGVGFQFFYVLGNAFRAGGLASSGTEYVYEPNLFLNGAVPAGYDARNRFLNYRRDDTIPKHRIRWNWIVDLPVGRGKKLLGNTGGLLESIVGGWQLAGFGTMSTNYWNLPTNNWGYLGKVEVYGTKYPIQDCRGGKCIPGYLYWNGYIPANMINAYDSKGNPIGVMGVPKEYQRSNAPLIPVPANGGSPSDPNYAYYDTNTTWVTLKNGSVQRTTLDTNLHPWNNQFFAGPRSWGLDASVFKNVRITEKLNVRFNADFFNVLNMPGLNQPGDSGILSLQNSANSPRQLQLTLRVSW